MALARGCSVTTCGREAARVISSEKKGPIAFAVGPLGFSVPGSTSVRARGLSDSRRRGRLRGHVGGDVHQVLCGHLRYDRLHQIGPQATARAGLKVEQLTRKIAR